MINVTNNDHKYYIHQKMKANNFHSVGPKKNLGLGRNPLQKLRVDSCIRQYILVQYT